MDKIKTEGRSELIVGSDSVGQRVDNFLFKKLKSLPKSLVYRLIRTGQVRLNGGRCKPTAKLAEADRVRIPPQHLGRQTTNIVISKRILQQIEQSILYEDEHLLTLNKAAGLAVHSGSGLQWGVIDAVRQLRPNSRIELVHRLDRMTSGCLLLAKTTPMLRQLLVAMQDQATSKRYCALLAGRLSRSSVTTTAPLRRVKQPDGETRVEVTESGQPAKTVFTRLQQVGPWTLVEAELFSGRTHQIRVHAQNIGCPVVGDSKYGDYEANQQAKKLGLNRLFLHAQHLALAPMDGERLSFTAPLPSDLRNVLNQLVSEQQTGNS